jgi:hypothetical protein
VLVASDSRRRMLPASGSLTKLPGCCQQFPFWNSCPRNPRYFFSYTYNHQILQLSCFDIHAWNGGIHPRRSSVQTFRCFDVLPTYSLSFQGLAHSFALTKSSSLFVSSNSALFAKNDRGCGEEKDCYSEISQRIVKIASWLGGLCRTQGEFTGWRHARRKRLGRDPRGRCRHRLGWAPRAQANVPRKTHYTGSLCLRVARPRRKPSAR